VLGEGRQGVWEGGGQRDQSAAGAFDISTPAVVDCGSCGLESSSWGLEVGWGCALMTCICAYNRTHPVFDKPFDIGAVLCYVMLQYAR
jgi:hypothetical protein